MGIYNHWYRTIHTQPRTSIEEVALVLQEAIGPEAQAFYFPRGDVISSVNLSDDTPIAIAFGRIPADGADIPLIERALCALAPLLVSGEEVAVLPGGLLHDALLYRIRSGRVERVEAKLVPRSGWAPIEPA